jgi:hypothetical protein
MRIIRLGQGLSLELVFFPCLVKGWEHPGLKPWFDMNKFMLVWVQDMICMFCFVFARLFVRRGGRESNGAGWD